MVSGSCFLVARDERFTGQTHVDQVYGGPFCFRDCDPTVGMPVPVTVGQATNGIKFRLVEGGHVAGNVSDSSTGDPLGYPTALFFYEWPSLIPLDAAFANTDGSYAGEQALPQGKYLVLASSPDHLDVLFDDVPCEQGCNAGAGDRIKVHRGKTTGDIDFPLDPGP